MTHDKSDIITDENATPDQLSAWARWQLPNMDVDSPIKPNALNIKARKHPAADGAGERVPDPDIKPPTAEEIETIRQAAYEDGLEEGRIAGKEEGYKAGYAHGESDVRAAVTRLGQVTRVLLEPIPAQDDELESAVLDLVENICKRVIQRELKLDATGLQKIVRTALDCLNPGSARIRIHLNPVDCDIITAYLNKLGDLEAGWRVVPHPTITPGGCIVETDNSLIDARAEKRLAAVVQQVFDKQQQAMALASSQQGGMEQLLDEVDAFPLDDLVQDYDSNTTNPLMDDPDSES